MVEEFGHVTSFTRQKLFCRFFLRSFRHGDMSLDLHGLALQLHTARLGAKFDTPIRNKDGTIICCDYQFPCDMGHTAIRDLINQSLAPQAVARITDSHHADASTRNGRGPYVTFRCGTYKQPNKPTSHTCTSKAKAPAIERKSRKTTGCQFKVTLRGYYPDPANAGAPHGWQVTELQTMHSGHEPRQFVSPPMSAELQQQVFVWRNDCEMNATNIIEMLQQQGIWRTSSDVSSLIKKIGRANSSGNDTEDLMKAICKDPDLFAVIRFDILRISTLHVVDSVDLVRVPGMSQLVPLGDSAWMRSLRGLHSETWGEGQTMFDFIPNASPSSHTTAVAARGPQAPAGRCVLGDDF